MDPDPSYLWKLIQKSSGKVSEEENKKITKELDRFKNKKHILETYRPGDDKDSFLHLVARLHTKPTDILRKLIIMCPEMVLYTRSGKYEGQTALHLLISTKNVDGVKAFFDSLKSVGKTETDMEVLNRLKHEPLQAKAVGSGFKNTVMMAQLPFSVAVLTFNKQMVECLLDEDAVPTLKNELGDTCFHSLIRYAKTKPQMLQNAMGMIYHLFAKFSSRLPQHKITKLLLLENDKKLTALKLAVSLGQVEMFSTLLKLGGVYSTQADNDGMCDIYRYDITEIDPLAQDKFTEMQRTGCIGETSKSQHTLNDSLPSGTLPTKQEFRQNLCDYLKCDRQNRSATSVLELICTLEFKKAFPFINLDVVKYVAKQKWKSYKDIFFIWAFLHLMFLIIFGICGWLRSKCIRCPTVNDTSDECKPRQTESPCCNLLGEAAGYVSCLLAIAYGCILIFLEFNRWFYFKQCFHIKNFFHNGIYRIIFLVFSLCLIVDSVWFVFSRDNNYFLVIAVVLGGWLCTFFLRAFKMFSFFCFMFLKVLFGDLLRLSVFILIQWLSFSTAFYLLFLTADEQPKTFSTFPDTIMAMFKLMLGLDDLESLCSAFWVTLLYALFVLLTYVLLLNSLIAMMSMTCSFVSQDRHGLCALQRLSITLHVESMLFPSWRLMTGSWETMDWSDHSTGTFEKVLRRDAYIASVQETPFAADSIVEAERQTGEQLKMASANNETYSQIFLRALKRTNDLGISYFTSSKPAKPKTEKKKKKKLPLKVTSTSEEQLRGTQDVDISNLSIRHLENAPPTHNFEMPMTHPFAVQELEANYSSCNTTQDLIQQSTLGQDQ